MEEKNGLGVGIDDGVKAPQIEEMYTQLPRALTLISTVRCRTLSRAAFPYTVSHRTG